ncbi:hypothetical protein ACFQE8_25120 [Salinirubellus sp. GCM10025818]|uniref:DUF7322 domain-containing protein n=1 Tax=Salinirubellus TaxID=2162630 RepID=UPI0030D4173F
MSDEADAEERAFWEESEDPWPDEPAEFDPQSLGPGVPEVPEAPEAPDPASGDAELSGDLVKAFWAAVLFTNVGLLGVSLGPMLVLFEGRTDAGVAAFLVGALALAFAYRRYRGYVDRDDGDDGDGPDGTRDPSLSGSDEGSGIDAGTTRGADEPAERGPRDTGGGG